MPLTTREWHIALDKSLRLVPKSRWSFSSAGTVLRILGDDGIVRTYKAAPTHLVAQEQAREIKKLWKARGEST